MPPFHMALSLREKVACLGNGDLYSDAPATVEAVETHMSWVFLTRPYAWKLKKPVRYSFLDYSTLAARRFYCEEEVRINCRLAQRIYIGTAALTVDTSGKAQINGGSDVVDYLVQMIRLPHDNMLDRMIQAGPVPVDAVRAAADLLARFYANAPPAGVAPSDHMARLRQSVRENTQEFASPRFGLPLTLIREVAAAQTSFITRHEDLLQDRVRRGRVIEAHGDLRPEHICIGPEPAIIDCLEFNRAFRILDTAEELSYLAIECQRLGNSGLADVFVDAYMRETRDAPAPALLAFYRSLHACLRAKIAIWHTLEPNRHEPAYWRHKALAYLELADTNNWPQARSL